MWLIPLLACTPDMKSRPFDPGGGDADSAGDVGGDSALDSSGDSAGDTGPDSSAETGSTGPVVITWPERRVGMFYLAWHAYAAKAMASLPEASRRTVDDVIAEDGASFADLIYNPGLYSVGMAFHYHQEPQAGFYCLYRLRDGEAPYDEPYTGPDCGDVSALARLHAEQLWDAGVDFVYMDLTNLPTMSAFGDVIGLRPLEVLLEEWEALREEGVPTPQIAAWVPLSSPGEGAEAMSTRVLAVYAAHWDSDILFRPDPGDPPVIFGVGEASAYDPALVAAAEAAGVTVAPLWGLLSESALAAGTAAWMQPCTSAGVSTTLVSPGVDCDQGWTSTSPLGTVVSASRSFQLGYASLPFQASGRVGGLTFQKQMETALAVQPDVLLLNAWNEHIAQPQANPYDSGAGLLRRSMGASDVADGDPSADWLWVDMYGAEFDRDFEPTVEDGGAGYALLQSCVRVFKSGATTCSDAAEACCQTAAGLNLVYSLRVVGGGDADTDHLLTLSASERDILVAGGAWEEIGTPFYAPPGLSTETTSDGPFQLYAEGGSGRTLLYRCATPGGHFFSQYPDCEGQTVEGPLGWMADARSSEMPRPLLRCYNSSTGSHPHSLVEACPAGTSAEAVLGYVR